MHLRVFLNERAVGFIQTAAREQDATADMGKTANAKWQHRCRLEYLLGTRENRLLLFLVREIRSHLPSQPKHLHPDTAHSFHVKERGIFNGSLDLQAWDF